MYDERASSSGGCRRGAAPAASSLRSFALLFRRRPLSPRPRAHLARSPARSAVSCPVSRMKRRAYPTSAYPGQPAAAPVATPGAWAPQPGVGAAPPAGYPAPAMMGGGAAPAGAPAWGQPAMVPVAGGAPAPVAAQPYGYGAPPQPQQPTTFAPPPAVAAGGFAPPPSHGLAPATVPAPAPAFGGHQVAPPGVGFVPQPAVVAQPQPVAPAVVAQPQPQPQPQPVASTFASPSQPAGAHKRRTYAELGNQPGVNTVDPTPAAQPFGFSPSSPAAGAQVVNPAFALGRDLEGSASPAPSFSQFAQQPSAAAAVAHAAPKYVCSTPAIVHKRALPLTLPFVRQSLGAVPR